MQEVIVAQAVLVLSHDTRDLFTAVAARMNRSFNEFIQIAALTGTVAFCCKDLGYEAIELDCFVDDDFLKGICIAWTAEFNA